jgi:hypothetical protein
MPRVSSVGRSDGLAQVPDQPIEVIGRDEQAAPRLHERLKSRPRRPRDPGVVLNPEERARRRRLAIELYRHRIYAIP